MYQMLDLISRILQDYACANTSISRVSKIVYDLLSRNGYDVHLEESNSRTVRRIHVDGHVYRIVRHPGWLKYDVIMVH